MKKKSFLLSALAITFLSFVTMAPSTWTLDALHSSLRFSVSSLMISEIEGSFKIKESTITAQKEDFSDAVVYLIADVNSIDTDVEERDTHLKSADFFDAAKYPDIVFKSTAFEKVSDKKYKVTGDLSFHGVTKPIILEAVANYGTHPMSKKTLAGFKVTGTIKRTDFGIATSTPTAMLGDEVNIVANAQFAKN
ncbi:MAG TPA: YceI family protein [Chitinophagaceae bacterium]|nr:YceI family protein [Chitinophagaceae bacterium]